MRIRSSWHYILVTFVIVTLSGSCTASSDSTLANYIEKENFNLQIYELAFCVEEVLSVIENDSTARTIFENRIDRAFDNRLNNAQIYIHNIELIYFIQEAKTISNTQSYPNSIQLLNHLAAKTRPSNIENFAPNFRDYVQSPEQVDDACLIALIEDLPSKVWNQIESDKLAMYSFNNWINFGFEEFRYYPGTKSKPKGILNKRIVEYLLHKHSKSNEPLIARSLKMIEKISSKY